MKFSVNWLREFVDLPDKIDQLAELLTLAGVEIKGIEERGAKIDQVMVAQIKESSRHPNADRLSVCVVDDGSGQTRQIVCGATNYKVGDKVLLALPGAKLPNGLEIKISKLRGVESEGMLCSGKELGFSDDAAGLLILSPESKIGAPIADLFPSDTILDVEITPNRGDLLSHYGLAREIAALVGSSRCNDRGRRSAPSLPQTHKGIEIAAPRECPFYSARKIDNVKIGPSPDWLRAKIEAAGIRSINNIVDISNFVMLELGQPTHAFDADKLKGGIKVRLARDGEKFLALDGKTYSLTPKDLVIADQERAVGLGGVMGGEETGVTESTKNVLLEAAYFLPASVRRTARALNLPSDASYRFERGVDPEMILAASNRAAELMREIAAATPAKEINVAGKLPSKPEDVSLRYEKCEQLLGVTIKPKTIDQTLERFGLCKQASKSKKKETGTTWKIPNYRRDLRRDVDLIEEVIRAYGIHKVTGTDRSRFTPTSAADKAHDVEMLIRSRLVARGFSEARTSKLIPRSAISLEEGAIQLKNPLSEDHVALRQTLMSGLIEVLERNIRAGVERVAIFELGKVFVRPPKGNEERHLGILLWGTGFNSERWKKPKMQPLDFFDLKEAIKAIMPPPGDEEDISSGKLLFRRSAHADLTLATSILWENQEVGFAGQLRSGRAAQLDTHLPICVAEIHLDLLPEEIPTPILTHPINARVEAKGVSARAILGRVSFKEISRFPAVTRDIAMIVPEELSHEKILETIFSENEPLLKKVTFFDRLTGPEAERLFGAARKSLAYTLTYRNRSRTLTNEEVTAAHTKIRERLRHELSAELRE